MKESKIGRRIVHILLVIYALILAYVVGGLIFNYQIPVEIFFGLSFALLFFTLGQSLYEMGLKFTGVFFLISAVIGYAAEVLGTSTGFPFGKYYYNDFLGEKFLNVPIVVPLLWFVITYLTFSLCFSYYGGNRVPSRSRIIGMIALAAFGTMAWDLMVDPMFVSYKYWVWENNGNVPTLSGVPVSNFVGWFVVTLLILGAFLFVIGKRSVIQRHNVWDTRIVYLLLFVDAAVANGSLSQDIVIVIGAIAMLAFVYLSYLLATKEKEKIAKEPSISQKV
jgi:uncharacterized membrane protein